MSYNKLLGYYTSEKEYVIDKNQADYWMNIVESDKNIDTGLMPDNLCNWNNNNNVEYPYFIHRTTNYFALWKGYIKIDTSGNYYFKAYSNNVIWIYIDNMDIPLLISNNILNETNIYLNSQYYKIKILYYATSYQKSINIKWNVNVASDGTVIPDNQFYYFIYPIQRLEYSFNQYLLLINTNINIKPSLLIGNSTNCIVTPELPYGLIINNKCEISGVVTTIISLKNYIITSKNYLSSVSVSIALEVIDNKLNNNLLCEFYETIDNTDNNIQLKYYSDLPFYLNDIIGINVKYNDNFYIKWSGYINIIDYNEYIFHIETSYKINFYLDSLKLFETTKKETDYKLLIHIGYHLIEMTSNNLISNDVPYLVFQLKSDYVDDFDNKLYHIPVSQFYYNYEHVTFISNIEIPTIEPYILIDLANVGDVIFSISPDLPFGLSLNEANGKITGKPLVTNTQIIKYCITLKSVNKNINLETYISLSIIPYISPPKFTFPSYSGTLLSSFTLSITYLNSLSDSNYIFYTDPELPDTFLFNNKECIMNGNPSYELSEIYTIFYLSPSGISYTSSTINIQGCSPGTLFIQFIINIADNDVNCEIKNIDSSIYSLNNPGSFNVYSFKGCVNGDLIVFSLQSGSLHGGNYKILLNNRLLRYNEYLGDNDKIIETLKIGSNTPIISYSSTNINVYLNIATYLCPSADYGVNLYEFIYDYIPDGFTLNSTTGCIYIRCLIDFVSSEISVKGKNDYGESNIVKLSFKSKKCSTDGVLSIKIKSGESGKYMKIQLSDLNNNKLLQYEGTFNNYEEWKGYCTNSKEFILVLGSTNSKAWDMNSKVTIMYNNEVLIDVNHNSLSSVTYDLSISSDIIPKQHLWQYSCYTPIYDWNINFGDNNWYKYSYNNFPERIIEINDYYYRTSFTYTQDISNVRSLLYHINTDCGFILEMNGKEVYRYNIYLNNNLINDCRRFSNVVNVELLGTNLLYGKNTISVKVIKNSDALKNDPFYVIMNINYFNPSESIFYNTYSLNSNPTMTSYSNNEADSETDIKYTYDYDTNTKFSTSKLSLFSPIVTLIYSWPDKASSFNQFIYGTANDKPENDMFEYDIYGSYSMDNFEWIKIKHSVNYIPESNSRSKYYSWYVYTDKSFQSYRFDVLSLRSSSSFNFHISEVQVTTIKGSYCETLSEWKRTFTGNKARASCTSSFQNGYRLRLCNDDKTWGEIEDYCGDIGTNSYYSNDELYFYYNIEMKYNPITNGYFNNYDLSCILNNGIIFYNNNGTISGKIDKNVPSVIQDCILLSYSDNNIVKFPFKIIIKTLYCEKNEKFNAVAIGEYSYTNCPNGYSGRISILCEYGYPAKWGNENDILCEMLEPEIEYPSNHIFLIINDEIDIEPKLINIVDSISFNKNLPDGLVINNNGRIKGKANAISDYQEYTFEAKNDEKTSFSSIYIGVYEKCASSINYRDNTFTFYKGIFNDKYENIIFNDGGIEYLEITSELTSGLYFNNINGNIYGNVNSDVIEGEKTYIINGYCKNNIVSTSIKIVIKRIINYYIESYCEKSGNYPKTLSGKYYYTDCETNLLGNKYRYCTLSENPVWEDEVNNCRI